MINVTGLSKRYGTNLAVKDVNFNIEKGEIIGFLGPNGAGKSTIMNILTGYLSMTQGQVLIDGYDITEYPEEAKKRIGHLYPKVTVPAQQGGGEATVIAWIWARTVKCPNPACQSIAPLMHSCILSKNLIVWMDGRAVEGTCLENRRGESLRGFESLSIR